MDFTFSPEVEAFRSEIREIIAATLTDDAVEEAHRSGTNLFPPLAKAFGAAGILERAVPGIGSGDPVEMWMLSSEADRAGAPFDGTAMALVVAGMLGIVGSDDQRKRIVPALLSGEQTVCFGFTEPDGGSDLAAIKTKATRTDDGWVVNGAKMWTTMAHVADWVVLLTRSDSSGSRYKGFTMFLLSMKSPGITVDPVWTLSTERSNATFYDDVHATDADIVGEAGEGWNALGVMLGFERGMANTGFLVPMLRRFAAWAAQTGLITDPIVRETMAQVAIDAQVAELLTQRTVWMAASGAPPGTEGSIAKVFATEAYQHGARKLQAAAGPEGLLGFHQPGAAADGWIDHDVRHAVPQTLQGGTSEINRNNIAERHLRLPRIR